MPRKIGPHSEGLGGRLDLLMKIPLEVPPRRKVVGRGFGVDEEEEDLYRKVLPDGEARREPREQQRAVRSNTRDCLVAKRDVLEEKAMFFILLNF
jgi:hypothetical protein